MNKKIEYFLKVLFDDSASTALKFLARQFLRNCKEKDSLVILTEKNHGVEFEGTLEEFLECLSESENQILSEYKR